MSDILEEIYARRRLTILRSKESFNEFDLYCPHCAHVQNDLWDCGDATILSGNEVWSTMDCQSCEKPFKARSRLTFDSEPVGESDEQD